ncbi:unnamed protein product [Calicophoron daubneyi]|uniref:Uncharacterized protein n=1 Tax=Calicophoron daubneyi TaxID=300641 RepID=A0AAV2TLQ2_CALDB
MATCNTNGLLKHLADSVFNEVALGSIPDSTQISSELSESKEARYPSNMAPRVVADPNVASNFLDEENGLICGVNHCPCPKNGLACPDIEEVQKPKKIPKLEPQPAIATSRSTPNLQFRKGGESPDITSRSSLSRQRLENCSDRLETIRAKSAAMLTRLVSLSFRNSVPAAVSASGVPAIVSRILAPEETESSSDDDEHLASPKTSYEENWLCTRAIISSQWHFLLSEIKRTEKRLRNLRILRASFRKWKASLPLQTPGDLPQACCSRAVPFSSNWRERHTYHDIASPKCAQLVCELDKNAVDSYVRCSCVPPQTGPCIVCCGFSPPELPQASEVTQSVDLLSRARPLCGHIHQKLSFSGDIQLSLRLESRLAASDVSFQPHKSTVHCVPPADKPNCLRNVIVISPQNKRDQTCEHDQSTPVGRSKPTLATQPRRGSRGLYNHHATRLRKYRDHLPCPSVRVYNTKTVNGSTSALRRILDLAQEAEVSSSIAARKRITKMKER